MYRASSGQQFSISSCTTNIWLLHRTPNRGRDYRRMIGREHPSTTRMRRDDCLVYSRNQPKRAMRAASEPPRTTKHAQPFKRIYVSYNRICSGPTHLHRYMIQQKDRQRPHLHSAGAVSLEQYPSSINTTVTMHLKENEATKSTTPSRIRAS